MEQLRFEAERAEREGNYERVAEIRYSKAETGSKTTSRAYRRNCARPRTATP